MSFEFDSFEQLNKLVSDSEDILSVTMEELREAHDVGRLGKHVVEAISGELAQRGLGHWPSELPLLQHESVRIYRKGTPVGNLIDAVTILKNWDGMENNYKNDQKIRDLLAGGSEEIVKKIRELVCN